MTSRLKHKDKITNNSIQGMKDKRIRLVIAAFLFLIIAASILAVMPDKVADHDSGATAAELEISESVDDNVTSTSYVNVDGVVTDAIDMGYATVQRTRNTEGRVETFSGSDRASS